MNTDRDTSISSRLSLPWRTFCFTCFPASTSRRLLSTSPRRLLSAPLLFPRIFCRKTFEGPFVDIVSSSYMTGLGSNLKSVGCRQSAALCRTNIMVSRTGLFRGISPERCWTSCVLRSSVPFSIAAACNQMLFSLVTRDSDRSCRLSRRSGTYS